MIKVGKVGYLNTLPLFYKWDTSQTVLVEGHPSELVDRLRKGELHAGIVSSVEYLFHKEDYLIVPKVCIASRERACSVLIFSNRLLEDIKSLYLTPASLTSKELAMYVVKVIYGNSPELVKDRSKADAIMLIGDEAMIEKSLGKWQYVYDLGEEWFKRHRLPFVFALFLVRRDAPTWLCDYIAKQCSTSKDLFFKDLMQGRIKVNGFNQSFLVEYFTSCLQYDLDEKAIQSLGIFNGFLMKRNL